MFLDPNLMTAEEITSEIVEILSRGILRLWTKKALDSGCKQSDTFESKK